VRAHRTPAQPQPVVTPDPAPRVAQLEAELQQMSQPQLNPLIVDLEPDALRGEAKANVIDIPPGTAFFNVILSTDASHPAYGLEVRDESGNAIWRGTGLKRSEYGTFTAALPARLVPPGRYELRLYGMNGSRESLLQRYHLRVTSN
jgi:hypothetical protein